MSNYQMERGWMDSEFFINDAYNERNAWEWLIGEAAYADGVVPVSGAPVQLKRGQLSASLRFMAQKWLWDKNKVDRFLKRLKMWDMIDIDNETASGTGQTIITICNYDKYQAKVGKTGTVNGTATNKKRDSKRDSSGTDAGQTINPSIQLEANIAKPDWLQQTDVDRFLAHRKAIKKPMSAEAIKLFFGKLEKIRAAGHDPVEAINEAILNNWQGVFIPRNAQQKLSSREQMRRVTPGMT
jgi:hypothetical protein